MRNRIPMPIKLRQRLRQSDLVTHPGQLDATQKLMAGQETLLNPVPDIMPAVEINMKNAANGVSLRRRQHDHAMLFAFHDPVKNRLALGFVRRLQVHSLVSFEKL